MTRQLAVAKEQNIETVVWASCFLSDYTIITGDSNGKVTFYDGKLGSLLHTYKIHDADVLTLATTKTERMVFASGVDPLFIAFEYVNVSDKSEEYDGKDYIWRRGWGHKMHSHDVRCIEIADNLVLSGGVDRRIVVARQRRKEGETTKVCGRFFRSPQNYPANFCLHVIEKVI